MPTFGNDYSKGLATNINGGCYSEQIATNERLLLKLDFPFGTYDMLDITLYYNFRLVRFLLTRVERKLYTKILEDKSSREGTTKFNILYKADDVTDECRLFIEYPAGNVSLHNYSIRRVVSQYLGLNIIGKVIRSEEDVSSYDKLTI